MAGESWSGRPGTAGPQVDDALHNFSRALEPTDLRLAEEKLLAEKVFDVLKAKSKFSIARLHYGGDVGRRTAIMCDPDFDLTVFINANELPIKDVLDDLASVISSFGISGPNIRQTSVSIQFKIPETGIEGRKQNAGFNVNLIPAINLARCNTNISSSAIAQQQLEEVTKRIEKDPKTNHLYSSSLVETQQDFMMQQNGYTQDLVRLAKFWYKSVFIGEFVQGGIRIVELAAVTAAKSRTRSLHDAFVVFLSYMNRFDHLRLAFYFEQGVWHSYLSTTREFEGTTPPRICVKFPGINLKGKERFILEPANYYNDILAPLSFSVIRKFMRYARESMDRFRLPRVESVEKGEPFLMLCNHFRPLPTKLINADSALHLNSTSADYLIGFIEESSSAAAGAFNPVVSVRNPSILRSSKIRKAQALQNLVDAHLQFITTTANAASYSGRRQNLGEIVDSVCQMIDQDIRGVYHQKWMTNAGKTHETSDVIFKVPISTIKGIGVIVVSVKWDYHGRAGNCYKQ